MLLSFLLPDILLQTDLLVAVVLVGIAVVVFIANRIGVLPAKGIPVVVGSLIGLFGIVIFRQRRVDAMRKQLEELRKQLQQNEKILADLRQKSEASEEETAAARAALDNQIAATKAEILRIRAETAAERERLRDLPPDQVDLEFDRAFPSTPGAPVAVPSSGSPVMRAPSAPSGTPLNR
jgi:hypothetical protein